MTDLRDRKCRKRLQNRKHQRARRSRMRPEKPCRHPYTVRRWRLDEEAGKVEEAPLAAILPGPLQRPLVHLIQYNVLQGLSENKYTLMLLAKYITAGSMLQPQSLDKEEAWLGHASVIPGETSLPGALSPTQLQSTVQHATWIDVLPFPQMRDNLIRREALFDHAELVSDLVGDFIDLSGLFHLKAAPQRRLNRGSFIIWGEPHDADSWEVTVDFLEKWGWTLAGCESVIRSSNHWRSIRGDEPLKQEI